LPTAEREHHPIGEIRDVVSAHLGRRELAHELEAIVARQWDGTTW
jgi:hypothetical protein